MFGFGKHIWIIRTLLKMSQPVRYHHDWSVFFLCYCANLLSSICYKMASVDPLKVHLHNAHDSAAAIRYVHNFCLAKQMPVSLNSIFVFICIHVSISKGIEVNPPPQGKGMSQCFPAAATVEVKQKHQDRLTGSLCHVF